MTPKEQKFCLAYVKNSNTHQSCREAGYSEKYGLHNGHKILERPYVIAEIKRLRERMNQSAEKSATDVVNEFSKIAFCDHVSFLKPDPEYPNQWTYKSPDELTQAQRDVVEHVSVKNIFKETEEGAHIFVRQTYHYRLSDKAKALEQMGRHYGLFNDKLKLSGGKINPFEHVSNAQLAQLEKAWVKTMNDPKLIEVTDFKEVKSNGS